MTTDFTRLLRDLESLDGCPRTKRRVLALLRRYAGRAIYISPAALVREERATTLRALSHATRAEQVRILAERWGVSRQWARRWVPK